MTRQSPWRRDLPAPFHLLQSELNRLMEEYWNPARLAPSQSPPMDLDPSAWSPAIDVFETAEEFLIYVELPGVDPASIDLSVTGNVLSLRGVKSAAALPEGHGPVRERRFGAFHRQVALTNEVNFEAVQAEARHGVLQVRLPKQAAAKPRTIPVQQS